MSTTSRYVARATSRCARGSAQPELPRSIPASEREAPSGIADDLDPGEVGVGGALEPERVTAVIDGDVADEPARPRVRTGRGRSPTGRRRCRPRRREAVAIEVVGEGVDREVPADQHPGRGSPRRGRTCAGSDATTDRPGGARAPRVRPRAGMPGPTIAARPASGRASSRWTGGQPRQRGGSSTGGGVAEEAPSGPVGSGIHGLPRRDRRTLRPRSCGTSRAARPGSRSARCAACTGCPRSPASAAAT